WLLGLRAEQRYLLDHVVADVHDRGDVEEGPGPPGGPEHKPGHVLPLFPPPAFALLIPIPRTPWRGSRGSIRSRGPRPERSPGSRGPCWRWRSRSMAARPGSPAGATA